MRYSTLRQHACIVHGSSVHIGRWAQLPAQEQPACSEICCNVHCPCCPRCSAPVALKRDLAQVGERLQALHLGDPVAAQPQLLQPCHVVQVLDGPGREAACTLSVGD
jgi:hypothetical protein